MHQTRSLRTAFTCRNPDAATISNLSPSRDQSQDVRLLSREDLKRLGISYSNVHMLRLEEQGKLPRRIYLSPARVAWVESEIMDYVARCIAAR